VFIAAAIAEGFSVRRISGNNPNAWFNVPSTAWRRRDYDCLGHPQLFDYCRAVMADPRTHKGLREDPVLRAEFSAKPLAGLDEQGRWRPLQNRASQLIEKPISSGFLVPRIFSGHVTAPRAVSFQWRETI
jgi:hypothetical protein